MQYLIVLALAAAAHAQSYFIPETPEVAAAKAAHFAEHAKAAALVGAPLPEVYRTALFNPFAGPVVTPQGFIADTPEVAAAKSAHFAEHARAAAAATPGAFAASSPIADYYRAYYNLYYPNGRAVFSGPHATPVVLPNGYLADTPEVAHAKATHLYKLYQESTRL